jgi:hypothetical protein
MLEDFIKLLIEGNLLELKDLCTLKKKKDKLGESK